ncbi:MAG TPA: phosphoglucosamine mutase, partial [Steroidobacteraceae bacterium]|nr:phosphoglucosamine mutase [Steroidobacteraceae bacterium]
GGVIGGETSGHILTLDKTTTGDALIAALQVLAVMRETGKSLAELAAGMTRYPQTLINVRVAKRFDPNEMPEVSAAVRGAESRLRGDGRIVLRASGTEPLIRVMVEARDQAAAQSNAEDIAAAVKRAALG